MFLEDDNAYSAANGYWVRAFFSTVARGWYIPWLNHLGRELDEGNPIFSAACVRPKRGVRVIQVAPTHSLSQRYESWRDVVGAGEPEEMPELVVVSTLDREGLAKFRRDVRRWATS